MLMFQASIILIFNGLLIFLVYKILSRKIEKRLGTSELLGQIRSEVEIMVVELNQVSERNIGLLEERTSNLSALLAEADKKIVNLGREMEKSSRSRIYSDLKPKAVPPAVPPLPPEEKPQEELPLDYRAEVIRMHRMGMDNRIIASRLKKTLGEIELIISWEEQKS